MMIWQIWNDFLYLHALCIRRNFIDRDKLTCFSSDFNHFVITHAQKWRYLHFRSEICCRLHLGEDLATRRVIFGNIFTVRGQQRLYVGFQSEFWHHYSTQRSKFSNRGILYRLTHILVFWPFLSLCMRMSRNGRIYRIQYLIQPSFSSARFHVKRIDMLAMWQHFG